MFKVPEKFRLKSGPLASDDSYRNNGAFIMYTDTVQLACIASDGFGWEHVSVHANLPDGHQRIPTWDEMCFIKHLFWESDDCVIQYHPSAKQYINNHKYTLHLWRPIGIKLPTPPIHLIGIKT